LKRIIAAFLFLAPFTVVAGAQEANCQNPLYQQEMNFCAAEDFQEADRELNRVYQQAIAFMKELDRDQINELFGAEEALRQAQRQWIKFRDAACTAEGFLFRGGTMEPFIVSGCLARLTRQRTGEPWPRSSDRGKAECCRVRSALDPGFHRGDVWRSDFRCVILGLDPSIHL